MAKSPQAARAPSAARVVADDVRVGSRCSYRGDGVNPAGEVRVIEETAPDTVRVAHVETGVEFGLFRSALEAPED